MPIRLKTDLVCLLEKHGDVHPILVDALMAAGMEAIDRMLSQVSVYNSLVLLNSLCESFVLYPVQ